MYVHTRRELDHDFAEFSKVDTLCDSCMSVSLQSTSGFSGTSGLLYFPNITCGDLKTESTITTTKTCSIMTQTY